MADKPNFLLGFGERLTEPVSGPQRPIDKKDPYSIQEAQKRLIPMIEEAATSIDALPDGACPRDEAVAIITLHPEFLAKSYYPRLLLRELRLETVGSRPTKVSAERTTRTEERGLEVSTELFVAGPRESFRSWAQELPNWSSDRRAATDLTKVELFRAATPVDKVKGIPADEDQLLLEVALHTTSQSNYVLQGFEEYAESLGAKPDFDRRFYTSGLCFLPVQAERHIVDELAAYSFLRVARPMPQLRVLQPVVRSWSKPKAFKVELPEGGPVDPQLRVAVFDGGVKADTHLKPWINSYDAGKIGDAHDEFLEHGSAVTSALLFGALVKDRELERPFVNVDHYRVLDKKSGVDVELYDVLKRIKTVLQTEKYMFVDLSVGPYSPIEDDDIHAWTAVLDDLLSGGDILASIAVGNGGTAPLDHSRIQAPSDCVNGLAVGSADVREGDWRRAVYSSVGPGRSPGVVKPDLLGFGGSEREPFWVIDENEPGSQVRPEAGTSFASPATLRLATGVRAHFGSILQPLAIKALLVHCCETGGERHETGWGRVPEELEELVICPDGMARIVYQGELTPGQYLRAQVPLPAKQLPGKVKIRATLCYATKVDASHPGNYTRAGVDIVFRPHSQKFDKKAKDPINAATDSFFQLKDYSTEKELRRDAHKWETTLHREKTKMGSSLHETAFDIHYNAREESAATTRAENVRYALVISVFCKGEPDLYNQVVRAFPTQIRPLQPVVQIPIQTRN